MRGGEQQRITDIVAAMYGTAVQLVHGHFHHSPNPVLVNVLHGETGDPEIFENDSLRLATRKKMTRNEETEGRRLVSEQHCTGDGDRMAQGEKWGGAGRFSHRMPPP